MSSIVLDEASKDRESSLPFVEVVFLLERVSTLFP